MSITQLAVQQITFVSKKNFSSVLASVQGAIGQPGNPGELMQRLKTAKDKNEVESIIAKVAGPTNLLQLGIYNFSDFISHFEPNAPKSVRLLIGNPLTMMSIAKHIPEMGLYAPRTVLIHERSDGVHLVYNKSESYLASSNNAEGLQICKTLDDKIIKILENAAN